MKGIDGKVAIVTGGACGIGAAIGRQLVDAAATVVLTDVNARAGAALARELSCDFLEHDVTSESQWIEVVQTVEARHGALHFLVNNAGISTSKTRSDPEHAVLAEWQAIQRVNVEGVFLGSRHTIPVMRRNGGGAIVNVSSIASFRSNPDNPAYGASKAAVQHMTKSTAVYCARSGAKVRCNSIHPGFVMTPMVERHAARLASERGVSKQEMVEVFRAQIPTGEFVQPSDIAEAVMFLLSDSARQITGTALVVDGGVTAT